VFWGRGGGRDKGITQLRLDRPTVWQGQLRHQKRSWFWPTATEGGAPPPLKSHSPPHPPLWLWPLILSTHRVQSLFFSYCHVGWPKGEQAPPSSKPDPLNLPTPTPSPRVKRPPPFSQPPPLTNSYTHAPHHPPLVSPPPLSLPPPNHHTGCCHSASAAA